jgi:hypothetical protein
MERSIWSLELDLSVSMTRLLDLLVSVCVGGSKVRLLLLLLLLLFAG